ncbi:MAG TPA: (2Fe-2S)-binding protein [Streptosporangiaceae bacterium]|nr:(2Fe-2S)-binding protein [Streptosporangiaceae bacterium]
MSADPAAAEVVSVRLVVNGTPVEAVVPARLLLSDFLRHQLGLTGTHVGCEHGVCGACTVILDGRAVRSCLLLAAQCEGSEIETIEGLTASGRAVGVQQAFSRNHGLQCGFCTPGFIVSAVEIIEDPASAGMSTGELRERLAGNLCRCTGYAGIILAVKQVIAARHESEAYEPQGRAAWS